MHAQYHAQVEAPPDVVEQFGLDMYNKLPRPVRSFHDEAKYISVYAQQYHLNPWWTTKQLFAAFHRTGCLRWTAVKGWPVLCGVREMMLDMYSVSQFPLPFLLGFAAGMQNSISIEDKVPQIKEVEKYKSDECDFDAEKGPVQPVLMHHVKKTLINVSIPLISLLLLPKLMKKDDGSSALMKELATVALFLVNTASCVQGFFSGNRLKRRIQKCHDDPEQYKLSTERKEQLGVLLPMLPVRVNLSTVERGLLLIPYLKSIGVIYAHMYPLSSQTKENTLTKFGIFLLGFTAFFGLQ